MSIRPVDFNGMIQRTQDVSTLKQNEDNRPVVEQQTIFSQEMKKVEQNLHQVVHAREKENAGYRYDAKEKGNGHYEKEERKKKDKMDMSALAFIKLPLFGCVGVNKQQFFNRFKNRRGDCCWYAFKRINTNNTNFSGSHQSLPLVCTLIENKTRPSQAL